MYAREEPVDVVAPRKNSEIVNRARRQFVYRPKLEFEISLVHRAVQLFYTERNPADTWHRIKKSYFSGGLVSGALKRNLLTILNNGCNDYR